MISAPERTACGVRGHVVRFVRADNPGWCEVRITDATGRPWTFIEKVPVVSARTLDASSTYPQPVVIACTRVDERVDERGRACVTIDTSRPWGLEATEGAATQFEMLASDVAADSSEPALVTLHASGLGLMLYAASVEGLLYVGQCYTPLGGGLAPPLNELVDAQKVVLLGTGSPQLDYALRVWRAAPSPELVRAARSHVRFGMRMQSGELRVRDGYDLLDWPSPEQGAAVERVPMPDGDYAVDALWLPEAASGPMHVHLFFTPHRPYEGRIAGDGWPFLEYRAC